MWYRKWNSEVKVSPHLIAMYNRRLRSWMWFGQINHSHCTFQGERESWTPIGNHEHNTSTHRLITAAANKLRPVICRACSSQDVATSEAFHQSETGTIRQAGLWAAPLYLSNVSCAQPHPNRHSPPNFPSVPLVSIGFCRHPSVYFSHFLFVIICQLCSSIVPSVLPCSVPWYRRVLPFPLLSCLFNRPLVHLLRL